MNRFRGVSPYHNGRVFFSILVSVFSLVFNACSHVKVAEDSDQSMTPSSVEAGTDPVPPTTEDTALSSSPATSPELSLEPQKEVSSKETTNETDINLSVENYTVRKNDTLMKIAFDIYGDVYQWRKIYTLNKEKIDHYYLIHDGMEIKIERPVKAVKIDQNGNPYRIKKNDTLGKISKTLYGTSKKWKSLWDNNKQLIHNPNKIFAGFNLYYVSHSVEIPTVPPDLAPDKK